MWARCHCVKGVVLHLRKGRDTKGRMWFKGLKGHRFMHQTLQARQIFDGSDIHSDARVVIDDGRIVAVEPADPTQPIRAGLLAPAFVDLQVNGGGGVLLGRGDPMGALATICATHARLGSLALFPTLITAPADVTAAVIDAAVAARDVPGMAGLHLEGPHLDPRRAGAHDPALIRPMNDADLALYLRAAGSLRLIITLAPEGATPAQISALAQAGVCVCLGHSDATEEAARAALAAGARGFTHLYNAMSPLTHRQPGMVGAALDGEAAAGIIADGVHVSASALRIARAALGARLFAVSDAMALAGTTAQAMDLDGRRITRAQGRLTLADGTLAGADITLAQSVAWLVGVAGLPLAEALAMVSTRPAAFAGLVERGHLRPGAPADLVWLDDALSLRGVWRAGEALEAL